MHTISFTKEALNITIRNICSGLVLTSPVYYSNGTTFHASPSQQIDTGTTTGASFGADPKQYCFEGAILYKIQRKHRTRTDNQPNSSTTSIEDTATNVHLLVVWDVKHENRKFRVWLIEYADDFTWDEVKLMELYKKYNEQFIENYIPNVTTWLTHDNIVVKTRSKVTYRSDYKLDIIISEETGSYSMEGPIKVDPKRLVLSLLMLIVLIYAVSIHILSSFELNIYNRCLNVDLVSPIYDADNTSECCRPPSPKVCAGSTMRSVFMAFDFGFQSCGTLIYRLQKRQPRKSTEIDESTSSAVHMLIVWSLFFEPKVLYADILLLEHGKEFDKDSLEKLRHENISRFRMCSDSVTEIWSLDDNTTLVTAFKIMNGGQLLNVAIFELEKDDDTRTIGYINPER
jgi:hypothetical protein